MFPAFREWTSRLWLGGGTKCGEGRAPSVHGVPGHNFRLEGVELAEECQGVEVVGCPQCLYDGRLIRGLVPLVLITISLRGLSLLGYSRRTNLACDRTSSSIRTVNHSGLATTSFWWAKSRQSHRVGFSAAACSQAISIVWAVRACFSAFRLHMASTARRTIPSSESVRNAFISVRIAVMGRAGPTWLLRSASSACRAAMVLSFSASFSCAFARPACSLRREAMDNSLRLSRKSHRRRTEATLVRAISTASWTIRRSSSAACAAEATYANGIRAAGPSASPNTIRSFSSFRQSSTSSSVRPKALRSLEARLQVAFRKTSTHSEVPVSHADVGGSKFQL